MSHARPSHRCCAKRCASQPAANLADKARAICGERYAEFLDNVQAYAYFPYAVAQGIDDFRGGEILFRFKPVAGRIDQGAGILFNLKPNGDYLLVRANALENNLVLFKYEKGKRSSVEWIRDTPTPSGQWQDLRVRISGAKVEGYLNGKLYLEHTLPAPLSGKIGVWSKADSVVFFDDYRVTPVLTAKLETVKTTLNLPAHAPIPPMSGGRERDNDVKSGSIGVDHRHNRLLERRRSSDVGRSWRLGSVGRRHERRDGYLAGRTQSQ